MLFIEIPSLQVLSSEMPRKFIEISSVALTKMNSKLEPFTSIFTRNTH